jgi:hypothetical protein
MDRPGAADKTSEAAAEATQEQDTRDGASASTVATAATEYTGATGPVPQRWIALEGSPRPKKKRCIYQDETDEHAHIAPIMAQPTGKRKRQEELPQRGKKKQKLRLSNHINPWTINSSRLRIHQNYCSLTVNTRTLELTALVSVH